MQHRMCVAVALATIGSQALPSRADAQPGATAAGESSEQDAPKYRLPRGLFGIQVGTEVFLATPFRDKGGNLKLGVYLQPFAFLDDWSRGIFGALNASIQDGDFSSYDRGGFELGYSMALLEDRRYYIPNLAIKSSINVDKWTIFYDNNDAGRPEGEVTALGTTIRPLARFGPLELSFPLELGRAFGQTYASYGIQLGLSLL